MLHSLLLHPPPDQWALQSPPGLWVLPPPVRLVLQAVLPAGLVQLLALLHPVVLRLRPARVVHLRPLDCWIEHLLAATEPFANCVLNCIVLHTDSGDGSARRQPQGGSFLRINTASGIRLLELGGSMLGFCVVLIP